MQNANTEKMLQALRTRLEHLDEIQEKLIEIGRLRAEARRRGFVVHSLDNPLRADYLEQVQGLHEIADELWEVFQNLSR